MSLLNANNIKFRNFQYFLAVAETRSFTRAAEGCHVTQSTLSSGIKDLETHLGHRLFDRSHREISLTAFGEKILPDIRDILQKSNNVLTQSRTSNGMYAGPFRFGVIPTIAPYALPHILPALNEKYPGLELILNENMSHVLVENVKNGSLDAALLAFPYDIEDLDHRILFEEGFYLLRPKSDETPPILKSDEIDVDKLLLLDDGHCLRDHALALCTQQDEATRKTFRATSLITLVQMVRHGYGTTLLPEMAVRELDLSQELDAIPVQGPSSKRRIGLIWRKGSPLGDMIEKIGDEIQKIEKSRPIRH